MITMLNIKLKIVFVAVLIEVAYSQRSVGDVCTLESTGSSGECKLFTDCAQAREDLQKNNRFPQTCGFQGTQPIVCCPKSQPTSPPTSPPTSRPTSASGRQPGVISKRKCREYSSYVYEKKDQPILLINASAITRNECGHKVVTLIVGGVNATRKEFPHMAVIGFEPTPGDIKWICGGSIISKDYILTAGHCLSHYDHGSAKYVRIGVTDLNDRNQRQELKIAERIPYPQYKSSSHYHDIGLIKLEQSARMNPYARPACLYAKPDITAQKAIATGWGHTQWGGSGSNHLLKVTLDLFDHASCNSSYKNQITRRLLNGIINDIQVCAGSETEEKDTCQGDSGGPLQIYHIGDQIKCMYDIVGITSFGKACSGSPGVYARVSHYVKWIEDIVWPQAS